MSYGLAGPGAGEAAIGVGVGVAGLVADFAGGVDPGVAVGAGGFGDLPGAGVADGLAVEGIVDHVGGGGLAGCSGCLGLVDGGLGALAEGGVEFVMLALTDGLALAELFTLRYGVGSGDCALALDLGDVVGGLRVIVGGPGLHPGG